MNETGQAMREVCFEDLVELSERVGITLANLQDALEMITSALLGATPKVDNEKEPAEPRGELVRLNRKLQNNNRVVDDCLLLASRLIDRLCSPKCKTEKG